MLFFEKWFDVFLFSGEFVTCVSLPLPETDILAHIRV